MKIFRIQKMKQMRDFVTVNGKPTMVSKFDGLLSEMRLLKRIAPHRNVVQTYDIMRDLVNLKFFVCMDYCSYGCVLDFV